ncbi:16043_t:CDS:2, partial [Racocetra persica]
MAKMFTGKPPRFYCEDEEMLAIKIYNGLHPKDTSEPTAYNICKRTTKD